MVKIPEQRSAEDCESTEAAPAAQGSITRRMSLGALCGIAAAPALAAPEGGASAEGKAVPDDSDHAGTFTALGAGASRRTMQDKVRERVSVKDFGAVGDGTLRTVSEWIVPGALGRYPSLAELRADYPHIQASSQSIDWAAFQAGLDYCKTAGANLFVPRGDYRINQTLNVDNPQKGRAKSFSIKGESGNSTRVCFENSVPLRNFFFIDTEISYVEMEDVELMDINPRTSRGFYFRDTRADGIPSWKHQFRNVRFTNFKEGVRFDGGSTPAQDAHESEVMFLHSKFRNCQTALIYNNTQAVNHHLIGTDFENDHPDDVAGKWVAIKFERGSVVNHFGGSVIGYGPYVQYTFPEDGAAFQATSQFHSTGVRIEGRGIGPFIDHDTASAIDNSNNFHLLIKNLTVVCNRTEQRPIFSRIGGGTLAVFEDVRANTPMLVQAYMTSHLSGNSRYGKIIMKRAFPLRYVRVSDETAYGGSGVAKNNYRTIPAEISLESEAAPGANDDDGCYALSNYRQTLYSGGWQVSEAKTLVYAPVDSAGLGAGSDPATVFVKLPPFARPYKFRLLRDNVNASSAVTLTLYAVIDGSTHQIAQIVPTIGTAGHFEAPIRLTGGLATLVADGADWDGKVKVVKSGTANGYLGLVMIDYM